MYLLDTSIMAKKSKNIKLPGFHRRGLPWAWNNEETFILVRNYLHTHGYELLDTNFKKWTSKSHVKIKHLKCDTWTSKMLNIIIFLFDIIVLDL